MSEQPTTDRMRQALRDLIHAYTVTLENARDRIIFLGGDCDSLETMVSGDLESSPEPAAEHAPMAWIGLPEGTPHEYDMVYDGTRKLPGYRYLPIWRPEDHPSARRAPTKGEKHG